MKEMNKINDAVADFRMKTPNDPTTIRINPKDYYKLRKECIETLQFCGANISDEISTYMGLTILIDATQKEGIIKIN
jgi:hypothetical protein